MPQSLIVPRSQVARGTHAEPSLPWRAAFWIALGLTAIGFLDAAFLWVPLRITEIFWRVSVIRATVDALPLATLGLTALLITTVHRQSGRALNGIAIFAGVVFV